MSTEKDQVVVMRIPKKVYEVAREISERPDEVRSIRGIIWDELRKSFLISTPETVKKTLPITDHFKKVAPAPVSTIPEHLKEKFHMPSNFVRPGEAADPMPPAVAGEPKFEAWLLRERKRNEAEATYPKGHTQNPYTAQEWYDMECAGIQPKGELAAHLEFDNSAEENGEDNF